MKKVLIISGIVLVLGSGLYYYYKRQVALLSNLTYQLLGVKLGALSGDSTDATITLRIISGSTIEAQITNLEVDVYVAGAKIGHITSPAPIIIPAQGYADNIFTITIDPSQVVSQAAQIVGQLISYSDASLMINGSADVKSSFLTLSIPVSYTTTLKGFI